MAAMQRNREARFTTLRDGLGLTDGNLASHAAKLVQAGYLDERRALMRSGFEMRYSITPEGVRAFLAYVEALRDLLEPATDEARALSSPEGRPSSS